MLDGLTLDQLRTFITAVETGSFSAAGRRLGRAQSVVSQTLANLEAQAGVRLFDRTGRLPVLTEAGRALLIEARAVAGSVGGFKARAAHLAGGLEPELSVVVDVVFPISVLTTSVTAFHSTFPTTPLRLSVDALGAVIQPVYEGRCAFALAGTLPTIPPDLTSERVLAVGMAMMAGAGHPLAEDRGPISRNLLAQHVQLVLTDRTELTRGQEFGVMSSLTWRLADLGAKHAFMRAGLGWGALPLEMAKEDLAAGRLVRLRLEDESSSGMFLPVSAVYLTEKPPGRAGRWLIDRIKAESASLDAQAAIGPTAP